MSSVCKCNPEQHVQEIDSGANMKYLYWVIQKKREYTTGTSQLIVSLMGFSEENFLFSTRGALLRWKIVYTAHRLCVILCLTSCRDPTEPPAAMVYVPTLVKLFPFQFFSLFLRKPGPPFCCSVSSVRFWLLSSEKFSAVQESLHCPFNRQGEMLS